MCQEVKVGVPITRHFPVFEDDGYTKHSGLTASDFTSTVYLDSAPVPVIVTVAEIGVTGEYEYTFTPPAEGLYDTQILNTFNYDIWGDTFQSVTELSSELAVSILSQCDKIDLVPTLSPHTVTSGSLMDRMMNKGVSKDYNQGTDSLQGIRDRLG